MIDEIVQEEQIEQVEQEMPQAEAQVQPKTELPAERNFRELEKAKLRAEKERDEAIKYAREVQMTHPKPEPEEEELTIGNDELVEGKHLKKVNQRYNKVIKDLQETRRQLQEQTDELRLKLKYPDFEKVVNKETIDRLKEKDSDVYDAISATTDRYKQVILAYNSIKSNGLYSQPGSYDEEKQLLQKNSTKPRPVASISPQQGDTPLSRVNGFANAPFDEEAKARLRREMEDARKNY